MEKLNYKMEELSEVQMSQVNGGCGWCTAIDCAAAAAKYLVHLLK